RGFVALGETLEDDIDCVEQVEDGNVRVGCWRGGGEFNLAGHARENIFLFAFAHLQFGGGVLEFFVFDELADEFPTRIFALVFALDDDLLVYGQQFAALDIHERRGHHEKLAGDLQVELAHEVNVRDELRGELGEVDLVNVHLLLLDEIEQQVERALK